MIPLLWTIFVASMLICGSVFFLGIAAAIFVSVCQNINKK